VLGGAAGLYIGAKLGENCGQTVAISTLKKRYAKYRRHIPEFIFLNDEKEADTTPQTAENQKGKVAKLFFLIGRLSGLSIGGAMGLFTGGFIGKKIGDIMGDIATRENIEAND